MLFSKNLFTTLLAVAAVGVNGFPVELEKRADPVYLCPNRWDTTKIEQCSQGEQCRTQGCHPVNWTDGVCIPDIGEFDGTISTVHTGPQARCILYS